MSLDTLVSQVTFRAHLLERALHDHGPWTVRFEAGSLDVEVPASRSALDDGVSLLAQFPALAEVEGTASLCLRGEAISWRPVTASETPFTLEWSIRGWIGDHERRAS